MTLVRRRLSSTPLAKSHVRRQHERPARRVRWNAFERHRHPEPALMLAARQLEAIAAGEYETVGTFSRLTASLAFNGAPFDLVSYAAVVPADEIRHAEYMLRMASLCAGEEAALRIEPETLRRNWTQPLDIETLDAVMVALPAISETVAFGLLSEARKRARDPVIRQVYTSVLGDEIGHLRLGWYYLKWREPQWSRAERQRAADVAGRMLVDLEPRLWVAKDASRADLRAARALGVVDASSLRRVLRAAVEREILPGLDALGLGASRAWWARHRSSR